MTSAVSVIVSPMKALVMLYRGESDAATAIAEDFLPPAREIGDMQILIPALTAATAIARERGDLAAAVGFVDEMEQAESSRSVSGYHHLLESLARQMVEAVRERFPRIRRVQIELRKLNPPTCPGHPAYAAVRLVRGAEDV